MSINTNSTVAQNKKFIELLTRPQGATAEELRVALNRVWAPTQYQLIPIAERLGYEYGWTKEEGKGARTHYHFKNKKPEAKAKAAKKPAAAKSMKKAA